LGAVFIAEQETIAMHGNQSIRGDYKMKSDRTYWRIAEDYEQNPFARFLMTVRLEIEPRYDTSYAVSLPAVMSCRNCVSRNANCEFLKIFD